MRNGWLCRPLPAVSPSSPKEYHGASSAVWHPSSKVLSSFARARLFGLSKAWEKSGRPFRTVEPHCSQSSNRFPREAACGDLSLLCVQGAACFAWSSLALLSTQVGPGARQCWYGKAVLPIADRQIQIEKIENSVASNTSKKRKNQQILRAYFQCVPHKSMLSTQHALLRTETKQQPSV